MKGTKLKTKYKKDDKKMQEEYLIGKPALCCKGRVQLKI